MIAPLEAQGISLPRLGLGTFRMQGAACQEAVESALALGYRHIDTAEMYGNEEVVGAAIAASGIARSDLHVTTKVWLDHVDLYLVHWPATDMDMAATLAALMRSREAGRTRAIGCQFHAVDAEPRDRRDRRANRVQPGRVSPLPRSDADARLSAVEGDRADRLLPACPGLGGGKRGPRPDRCET